MSDAILYGISLLLALTGLCLVVEGIRRLVSRGQTPYVPAPQDPLRRPPSARTPRQAPRRQVVGCVFAVRAHISDGIEVSGAVLQLGDHDAQRYTGLLIECQDVGGRNLRVLLPASQAAALLNPPQERNEDNALCFQDQAHPGLQHRKALEIASVFGFNPHGRSMAGGE